MGNVYATGFGGLSRRQPEAVRRLLTRQLRRSRVQLRTPQRPGNQRQRLWAANGPPVVTLANLEPATAAVAGEQIPYHLAFAGSGTPSAAPELLGLRLSYAADGAASAPAAADGFVELLPAAANQFGLHGWPLQPLLGPLWRQLPSAAEAAEAAAAPAPTPLRLGTLWQLPQQLPLPRSLPSLPPLPALPPIPSLPALPPLRPLAGLELSGLPSGLGALLPSPLRRLLPELVLQLGLPSLPSSPAALLASLPSAMPSALPMPLAQLLLLLPAPLQPLLLLPLLPLLPALRLALAGPLGQGLALLQDLGRRLGSWWGGGAGAMGPDPSGNPPSGPPTPPAPNGGGDPSPPQRFDPEEAANHFAANDAERAQLLELFGFSDPAVREPQPAAEEPQPPLPA
jgi:hypothetical protein